MEDGRIQGQVHGEKNFIDQVLIREQLGISKEEKMNATNATFEKARTTFKKIAGPYAFLENE